MLADEYILSFISLSAHIRPTEFYQLLLLSSSSVFQISSGSGLDIIKYQHNSKLWPLPASIISILFLMAIRDRQILITDIVSKVLNQPPQLDKTFDWFINKHSKECFGEHFTLIEKIFKALKGNAIANQSKRTMSLNCDAYFGGHSNLLFEFDEFQHFSSARQLSIEHYPDNLKLNFSSSQWKQYCVAHKAKADKYRHNKTTVDFDFAGGRTFQRAYLDCFRDLLPTLHGLRPTLRINEFEVDDIYSNDKEACKKIEKLIKSKLVH